MSSGEASMTVGQESSSIKLGCKGRMSFLSVGLTVTTDG